MVAVVHEALTGQNEQTNQLEFTMEASDLERGWEQGSSTGDKPVGEVAGRAREAAEEFLELAEGGMAGEVGGGIAARAGELRLVAVEHGPLVPTRHGCGCGWAAAAVQERMAGAAAWTGICGGRRRKGELAGKRVIERWFGGKAVEVLAGGGC